MSLFQLISNRLKGAKNLVAKSLTVMSWPEVHASSIRAIEKSKFATPTWTNINASQRNEKVQYSTSVATTLRQIFGVGTMSSNSAYAPNGISKQVTIEYLTALADIIQHQMDSLPELVSKAENEATSEITDAEYISVMIDSLDNAVQVANDDLLKKYGMMQDDFDAAIVHFQHDDLVHAAHERLKNAKQFRCDLILQTIDKSIDGQTSLLAYKNMKIPDDVTSDMVVEFFAKSLDTSYRAAKEAIDEAKAQGMKDAHTELDKWKDLYRSKHDEYWNEVFQETGPLAEVLPAAIGFYGQDSEVSKQIAKYVDEHDAKLEALGITDDDLD